MIRWYEKFTRRATFGFMLVFAAWMLFGVLAVGGAGRAPSPQPELQRTEHVKVCGRSGCVSGYVKPWIAETYNWLTRAMFGSLAVLLAIFLICVTIRKIETGNCRLPKTPNGP
jgi:hypothetical protein